MTRIHNAGPITTSTSSSAGLSEAQQRANSALMVELAAQRAAHEKADRERQRAERETLQRQHAREDLRRKRINAKNPSATPTQSGAALLRASNQTQGAAVLEAGLAHRGFEHQRRTTLTPGEELAGLVFMLGEDNTDLGTGQPKPIGARHNDATNALKSLPLEIRAALLVELALSHKDDANALIARVGLAGSQLEPLVRTIAAAPAQHQTLGASTWDEERISRVALDVIGLLEHRGGQGVAVQKLSDLQPNDANAVLGKVGTLNAQAATQLEGQGFKHAPVIVMQAKPQNLDPAELAQGLVYNASRTPSAFGAAFVSEYQHQQKTWKLTQAQTLALIRAAFGLLERRVWDGKNLRVHLIAAKIVSKQEMRAILNPIVEETLTLDAFLEQIATNLVYSNDSDLETRSSDRAPVWDADTEQNKDVSRRGSNPKAILEHFGYRASNVTTGKWGLQLRLFVPTGKNPKYSKTILAFRGTESVFLPIPGVKPSGPMPETLMDTAIADFSGPTGYAQFKQNKALIERNLEFADAQTKTGKPIVTGHSLGGALAQITGATFPNHTGEVVTFMSPAINQSDVKKLEQFNKTHGDADDVKVRHYRMEGDIVPTTGDAMLTGQLTTFSRQQATPFAGGTQYSMGADFAMTAHTTHPLAHLIRQLGAENPDQAILEAYGAHDPALRTNPDVKDVNINVTDSRDLAKDKDPRRNLSAGKPAVDAVYFATACKTFFSELPFHLLLEHVEKIAATAKTIEEFKNLAQTWLGSQNKLKLQGTQSQELAKTIGLEDAVNVLSIDGLHYQKLLKDGVAVSNAKTAFQDRRLEMIWKSWQPQ